MQLDYASILKAGQSLVPDMREQVAQRQEMELRGQEVQMRQQAMMAKLAEAEREAAERQAYNADLEKFQRNPNARDASALMLKYPDLADKFKAGWDVLDDEERRTNLTQSAEILNRLERGDVQGAAAKLKVRLDADREAGQDVTDDEQVYGDLMSGDPQRVNDARGIIAFHTRMGDPEAYDKLYPPREKVEVEKQAEYYRSIGRNDLAETLLTRTADPVVVGQPGAPIFRTSDFLGTRGPQQGGGDPASAAGAGNGAAPDLAAMLRITVQSESGGNPKAISPKGARGLMQVMPATGRNPGFGGERGQQRLGEAVDGLDAQAAAGRFQYAGEQAARALERERVIVLAEREQLLFQFDVGQPHPMGEPFPNAVAHFGRAGLGEGQTQNRRGLCSPQ